MSFSNKVVLITGAAGNLGRAVASAFASAAPWPRPSPRPEQYWCWWT